MKKFEISADHRRWARARVRSYGGTSQEYLDLIAAQRGKCAFSKVPLFFDSPNGGGFTPGCAGCHPVYVALDHCAPGSRSHGFQIVSYALNDLKGHLPLDCFLALTTTQAWKRLMKAWRQQYRIN